MMYCIITIFGIHWEGELVGIVKVGIERGWAMGSASRMSKMHT
jgi:hypothetical protein